MSKFKRKRYKEELEFEIPAFELSLLQPLKSAILLAFTDDSLIEFADSDVLVWDSIKTTFSKLSISTKIFRIFVLQCKYSPEDLSAEEDDPKSNRPIPNGKEISNRAAVPIAQFEIISKKTDSTKTTFLPTIPISAKIISHKFPTDSPLEVIESRLDAHLPLTVVNSDSIKLVLKRCTCDFQFGAFPECICLSVQNEFLVPHAIQAASLRNSHWEFLVAWRPFADGSAAADNWVPRWPLSLWSLKCYTRFIESRARVM